VVVRCEFVSKRSADDHWGPTVSNPQEIPATYFTQNFDTFKSYLGEGRWRTESTKPGPPWSKANPPRKVMACFNQAGQGVAIFSPNAESWNYGPHAGGKTDDPLGAPCVHIAPVTGAKLAPRSIYAYRYWLVVGTEDRIVKRLNILWEKYAADSAQLTVPK